MSFQSQLLQSTVKKCCCYRAQRCLPTWCSSISIVQAPTRALPPNDNDQDVVADDDGASFSEHTSNDDGAVATEHGPDAAAERVDAAVLPLDLPAEFLIGAQGSDAHDPVDLMIAFQKNLELVQEGGKRIHQLEQRRLHAASSNSEEAVDAAAAVAAEKAMHSSTLVELRRLAHSMGAEHQQKMKDALASARAAGAEANTLRRLHIK